MSCICQFQFWADFVGNICVAVYHAPKGLEPRNKAENLSQLVDTLGQLLTRNHAFHS